MLSGRPYPRATFQLREGALTTNAPRKGVPIPPDQPPVPRHGRGGRLIDALGELPPEQPAGPASSLSLDRRIAHFDHLVDDTEETNPTAIPMGLGLDDDLLVAPEGADEAPPPDPVVVIRRSPVSREAQDDRFLPLPPEPEPEPMAPEGLSTLTVFLLTALVTVAALLLVDALF